MVDALLGVSYIFLEKLNSIIDEGYYILIETNYGENSNKAQTVKFWQTVKFMMNIFLGELIKAILGLGKAYLPTELYMRVGKYL